MGAASKTSIQNGRNAQETPTFEKPTARRPRTTRAGTFKDDVPLNGATPEQALVLDEDDDVPIAPGKEVLEVVNGVITVVNSASPPTKKRKGSPEPAPHQAITIDDEDDEDGPILPDWKYTPDEAASPPKKQKRAPKPPPGEKRERRFRKQAPQSFDDIYERALSQRFYVLKRTRGGSEDCPEESVEMTGSTGNIYTVNVGKLPTCTCPHAQKGHQCKHVLYVLSRVLNAPLNLVYQLALVSSELRQIFARAPAIVSPEDAASQSNNRKEVEGDCPICFSELDANSPESVVWCRAACGQNIHQQCFEMWARTKGSAGADVTCPFCRSAWKGDEDVLANLKRTTVLEHGYVNVAAQLGISTMRDHSSYSRWYGIHQRRGTARPY